MRRSARQRAAARSDKGSALSGGETTSTRSASDAGAPGRHSTRRQQRDTSKAQEAGHAQAEQKAQQAAIFVDMVRVALTGGGPLIAPAIANH